MKTLDRKLGAILRGGGAGTDFIIADAKDADMGGGRPAPGPERGADGRPLDAFRPLAGYLDEIRAITRQGIVDVMLVSSSTLERLGKGVFESSQVTPAIRANDTTDIWGVRGGANAREPSRPFRTASLSRARELGCDLCLYSITFNNRVDDDLRSLAAFRGLPRGRGAVRHALLPGGVSTPTSTQASPRSRRPAPTSATASSAAWRG